MIRGLVVTAALGLWAAGAAADVWEGNDRVQAYIGVTQLEDQTGELQNDRGEPVEIDFANLFALGIEVETPRKKKEQGVEWGINAGGGFSWKGSDTRFAGTVEDGRGTAVFRIDNEMLLLEGHIGPYFRAHAGPVDFYLSAGPALIYGEHDVDDEDTEEGEIPPELFTSNGTIILSDDSSSDIIIGYYARTGVEWDLGGGKSWGLGVRYLGGELDFNDTVGEFDLEAVQILLTYSAWF